MLTDIGPTVELTRENRETDRRNQIGKMSFPLHAHHIMILATLTFVVAVTTPEWYISPANHLKMNIFQICAEKTGVQICEWTLSTHMNNKLFEKIRLIYPIVAALLAIICVAISLTCLFLGSWYIQRFARENKAKWLPILISIIVLLCFLFSCAVWIMMLTVPMQQTALQTSRIFLSNLGFSFWIGVSASGLYLYAIVVYSLSILSGH